MNNTQPTQSAGQAGAGTAGRTPGPWRVTGDYAGDQTIIDANGSIVAIVDARFREQGGDTQTFRNEGVDTARLIAAAPELLEACRQAHHFASLINNVTHIMPNRQSGTLLDTLNDAITRATGGATTI